MNKMAVPKHYLQISRYPVIWGCILRILDLFNLGYITSLFKYACVQSHTFGNIFSFILNRFPTMHRTTPLKNGTLFSTDGVLNLWLLKQSQRGQIGPPKNQFSFSPNASNHIQMKLFMSPLDENLKNFLNGPNYQLLFLDL